MGLRDEIRQQPSVVRRLLDEGRAPIAAVAETLRGAPVDTIVVAARGTSDHAAVYAQYVFGVRHRQLVALAAPSVISLYETEPGLGQAVVVGISQSGASPDIVGVVAAARRQGVPTIAITNSPASALARAAAQTINLLAGPEHAVAATKTYTAELTAIALLSALVAGSDADLAALDALPAALEAALETEGEAERLAGARGAMTRCVVLGRGYEYATAREWALKLKELARVLADPYSSADFQHGPLALLERGFPVLAVVPSGPPADDLIVFLRRIRHEHGVDLVVISDRADARALGDGLAVPVGVPDWLMPIVSIVPAQLFAYHLARARGLDPDAPRNISKVTLTR